MQESIGKPEGFLSLSSIHSRSSAGSRDAFPLSCSPGTSSTVLQAIGHRQWPFLFRQAVSQAQSSSSLTWLVMSGTRAETPPRTWAGTTNASCLQVQTFSFRKKSRTHPFTLPFTWAASMCTVRSLSTASLLLRCGASKSSVRHWLRLTHFHLCYDYVREAYSVVLYTCCFYPSHRDVWTFEEHVACNSSVRAEVLVKQASTLRQSSTCSQTILQAMLTRGSPLRDGVKKWKAWADSVAE